MGEPLYTIEGNTHSMAFPDGERLEGVQPHLDHTGRLWVRVTAFLPNGNLAHRTRMDLLNQRELEQFHQTATAMDGQFNIDWRGRLLYFQQQVLYTLETPEADTAVAVDDAAEAWPVLADAALHGLVGEIVRTIDPYTEADRMAILLNILVGVGNLLGTTPHASVQHDWHPARLFAVLVGQSSKGRKGTGWSTPRYLLSKVDQTWSETRVKSGLSSGEGLIYNVRDAVWKKEPIKDKGRVVDYQEVLVDDGEKDKRLLVIEPEFASTLTVMGREGNTLSAVMRQAWDDGHLSPLTRNSPIKATGAHISLIGHITKQELLARMDDTSKANGFANRFLWALVRRSKELPEGAAEPEATRDPLIKRLSEVFTFARAVAQMQRNAKAKALWAEVYGPLSAGKPGLLGAVLSRAEAQVLRLSIIYALLDKTAEIGVTHLEAALAVWEYCEQSARLIFGARLGDPTADRILEALRTAGPQGMSENEIYELFGKHKSANDRARALNMLVSLGLATFTKEGTGGRPRTVWKPA
jgi:hypothetical protein